MSGSKDQPVGHAGSPAVNLYPSYPSMHVWEQPHGSTEGRVSGRNLFTRPALDASSYVSDK